MSYRLIDNDTGKDIIETLNNLKEENNQLQSNWNSLRKELKQAYRELFENELVNGRELINNILDKMNELKGKDKE